MVSKEVVMGNKIIVKYGYKLRPTGWEWDNYKRFATFGEALHWCMETRASGKILGFRVIDITKDYEIKIPDNWGCGAGGYKYEGSTDAEILGMRY
jgi:hypothetical protein